MNSKSPRNANQRDVQGDKEGQENPIGDLEVIGMKTRFRSKE